MLIFDMDGVLTDSNGVWRDVDEAFLAKRGMAYTREYYEGVAHTVFPLAAVFTKEYCQLEESTQEIMDEWMEMAGDVYAARVPLKPHVRDYLEHCRRAGERMIVLTSAVPEHCRAALTRWELLPYFERVFFAQELGLDKRESTVYKKVAALMGVAPGDCTVFDDSLAACRSAKAAGMQVVGVYDPFFDATEKDMRAVCDRFITDFSQLL